jgi:para-aminobenzoate synthetase/4-amino-4-deoxychorismate lyase
LKSAGAAGKQAFVISAASPFVLLDDARAEGAAPVRLYRNPVEVIETRDPAAVRDGLARVRHGARGLHAAGFLAYEAGHALEERLAPLRRTVPGDAPPLLGFGLFEECEEIAPAEVAALLGPTDGAWLAPPVPQIGRDAYGAALSRVKEHLAEGDIYQVNLTFMADVHFAGAPPALYALLRARAQTGHGGLLFTGDHWLLSLSPELFFALDDGKVTVRPMKGTALRNEDPVRDAAAAAALAADAKEQAENLMIVDLMRNDLSRVAQAGTVQVPALFTIEPYPTVHQMTSTVTALLEPGLGAIDILGALFPCGSVTGAPKIRAMEIIAGLEAGPRRIYTGSIGSIAPSGEARFNVAIRSLSIRAGAFKAEMGLGSGIVADSRADEDWRECLAKGRFVNQGTDGFDLIETMGFDPHDGIPNLERHLARMKNSADALGFAFDRHDARNELQAATFRFREAKKIRLRLSRRGSLAIEARPFPESPKGAATVALLPLPTMPDDFRLRHKTSDRSLYEEARRRAGTFEVIFADADGCLTEGSFTNLFVERGGMLLTPPLSRPLLPGVLREQLIAEGDARETDLRVEDLQRGFFIGNALRGLMRARLVE